MSDVICNYYIIAIIAYIHIIYLDIKLISKII